jgi:serine/threonine-protein kinase CTR1
VILAVVIQCYRRHRHQHQRVCICIRCPLFPTQAPIVEKERPLLYGSTAVLSDLSSFLIPHTELHLKERIGSGSYGTVYQAKLHGLTVAVKRLNLQDNISATDDAVDDFIQEAVVLSKLHHENIVRLLGVCTDPGYISIVMEYVRQGSVKKLLLAQNVHVTWQRKLQMLIGASNGMVYLHSRQPPVIHRDLKSSNLLVNRECRVKLCDFGVSKYLKHFASDFSLSSESGSPDSRVPGTLCFTAPELMLATPKLTAKADVYSFGIVMWEFAAASVPPPRQRLGKPSSYLVPFADLTWSSKIVEAVCQGRRPDIPGNCPDCIQSLMKQCWHGQWRKRPAFTDILERLKQAAAQIGLTLSSDTSDNES